MSCVGDGRRTSQHPKTGLCLPSARLGVHRTAPDTNSSCLGALLILLLLAGCAGQAPTSALPVRSPRPEPKLAKSTAVEPRPVAAKYPEPRAAEPEAPPPWTPTQSLRDLVRPYTSRHLARAKQKINELTQILAAPHTADETCDLSFRLAEAHFAMAWSETGPALERAFAEAAKRYQQIFDDCPGYERADEVLFALVDATWRSGNRDEAARTAVRLTERFPKSILVVDAWLIVGERDYLNSDCQSAIKAYRLASVDPRSMASALAQFRLAHCFGTLQRWRDSMKAASTAVHALEEGDRPEVYFASIQTFVEAYSHIGTPEAAQPTFEELTWVSGTRLIPGMLDQLRDLWIKGGEERKARRLPPRSPIPTVETLPQPQPGRR